MSSHRGRGRGRGRASQSNNYRNGSHASPQPSTSRDEFIHSSNHEMNGDLPERFRKGRSRKQYSNNDDHQNSSSNGFDISLNTDIRKYVQIQNSLASTTDKDKWIDSLEIPTSSEIHLDDTDADDADKTKIQLVPNKPHEKFKTVRNYLKTHYTLLREDAVGPLRDAIDKFRQEPDMDDDKDVSIYEKVHVSGFTFTHIGIAARLRFSTKRVGRKILWSASKRLVSGSLVALTPANDRFKKQCIVAIVAARPLELLEQSPPEVDIYFSRPEDIQIDPQVEYLMLESKQGYFEASRHTLKAMQKLSRECFPISQLIIGTDTHVGPPQYLVEAPNKSLLAAMENDSDDPYAFSSVDILNDWPQVPDQTTLDFSQWAALQQILTKKLAIIQGPPGTGKTHVSKVALQIMIQNRVDGDPPLIIAAQTNHALDQLLQHVSLFEPNYIRLGGRSTNNEIRKRALFEVRKQERIPPIPGSLFNPSIKKLEREHARYGEILSIFDNTSDVISDEKLFKLGVINAAQQQSLVEALENWVTTDNKEQSPMQYWLHQTLVPFEVNYDDDNFGFEEAEEDLEIEQLRETEAEHGIADEEDIEMLRGPWKAVFDDWTVPLPSQSELREAEKMLKEKQDLWDVPDRLRGPVYLIMKQRAKKIALDNFRQAAVEYTKIVEELKIGKWEKDAVFLKRAHIIGMTTTGLSKYRPLISSLRPKIVLIEEAAEVIESPVTAACMESLEHLILVGDHKQLQGHCSLQDLEGEPFYLNISMFERLVNINMPYITLSRQRRMIPEIRKLISSLYPTLDDHKSILTQAEPPQWGTGTIRSFFFHHEWSEYKDDSFSAFNSEEASMVAKFYRHLLRHGVPASAITILTFYNGQRKRILRELRDDAETNASYAMVKTVDSYQGEENDIIILSLVRNNNQGQIGFLGVENRVCVALSRARKGLYLFGHYHMLSEAKKSLWPKVCDQMRGLRSGNALPLTCVNHIRTTKVRWPTDFDANDGGCDYFCKTELSCGHTCPLKCHAKPHELIQCKAACGKTLGCGHICTKQCHEVCHCDCGNHHLDPALNDEATDRGAHGHDMVIHRTPTRASEVYSASPNIRNSPIRNNPNQHPARGNASSARGTGRGQGRGVTATQPLPQSTIQPIPPPVHNGANAWIDATKAVDKSNPLWRWERPLDWEQFADGGVKQDDLNREAAHSSNSGPATANLLDLTPSEIGSSGRVEHSTEQKLDQDRSKYTQTYRPAVSNGFGFDDTRETEWDPYSTTSSQLDIVW